MRRWLSDLAPAAVAVALGLFLMANSIGEGDGAPIEVEAATGALAVVGLIFFRRRYPVALTLVLMPFGIVFAMPMGALPVALFAVAVHRPGRVAIAVAALHLTLATVVYALVMGFAHAFWEGIAFLALLQVSVVAVGMLIRSHRQLVASWAERARQAEEGQRLRVDQARLAERERIAREMHDVLAHRISLLAVHAGALEVRRDASPEEQRAAGTIRQSAYDALEDLRTVIGMLRTPGEDRPQPTLGDVPALVEQSREAGAEVGLAFDGADGVPEQVGRNAYRIVQEALTNARKHAPGAPIQVAIHRDRAEPGLTVEVGNALAAGGGQLPGAGAGLAGLRERVQLVGGRLEHGPTPAGEFQLKAWLPWTA
ncbi:histidine kinase [Actinoplanes sp. NPDC049596]|uniref:sensor histidine kinase n=1 Tax=unclassified Actinoplanes TaxID=2626549 RepID=UPI003420BFE4